MADVREVDVVGVRVEMPSNQPIVLLREVEGQRYLPIWIGAVEATAIAFAQQGVVPPRPLTHDLLKDVLEAHRQRADARSRSPRCKDGIFFADAGASARASRSAPGRPTRSRSRCAPAAAIVCAEEVLDEAGIAVPDEQEDEVEKFREFLDQVTPEDFEPQRVSTLDRGPTVGQTLDPQPQRLRVATRRSVALTRLTARAYRCNCLSV